MSRIAKKLRCQAGESITETLVALLVAALALTMLAGAIASSGNLITKSRKTLDDYYSANEADTGVVKMSGPGTSGSVTIKLNPGGNELENISIQYYENDKFGKTPVIAYKKTPVSTSSSSGNSGGG